MKPDIFMPLYIGDYLRDTLGLSRADHGSYLLLIMAYWANGGPLHDDDDYLREVARCDRQDWARCRGLMLRFFTKGDGVWRHKRVDEELEAACSRTGKASSAATSRWQNAENNQTRSERMAEARKKGTHTDEQWNSMLSFHEHKCAKCGSSENIVKDHITPIYKGGSDGIDNIQPLCRSCNSAKGPDTTDWRRDDWQNHCLMTAKMPAKMPAQPLRNDSTSPSPSPSPSKSSKVQATKLPAKLPKPVLTEAQKRLADGFEEQLNGQWPNDAGKWIRRIVSNSGKSSRVLAELSLARREDRIATTPAQYAEQLWKEFA